MNSTINKIFCTCSGELLFLRYNKICKKAVIKLGSFLQYLVHIFLGHDGCVRKINLRILWNHSMKNFQVKHGQCGSIIFPQNIFFWRLYRVFQIVVKGGGNSPPSGENQKFCLGEEIFYRMVRTWGGVFWWEGIKRICWVSLLGGEGGEIFPGAGCMNEFLAGGCGLHPVGKTML